MDQQGRFLAENTENRRSATEVELKPLRAKHVLGPAARNLTFAQGTNRESGRRCDQL
jgi:hypothetical protein